MFSLYTSISHIITITDDKIIEQCGSTIRDIDSLMDIRYCPIKSSIMDFRIVNLIKYNGQEHMAIIFDTDLFEWHPDYLRQFSYIESLQMVNMRESLQLDNIEMLDTLPPIGMLVMKNLPLSHIPNEWLLTPETHTLDIIGADLAQHIYYSEFETVSRS